ncbi:MAG: nickel-responsive transcriptional regulator NikR [Deltaproteobacteria bacterium]|nr:nickel-responsive transcriptional regulator NikR [Candidatus Zymogenaceae bacterium]
MSNTKRFGVSLDGELLDKFDEYIEKKGYQNRSEAIRDLIRDRLVRREWEEEDGNRSKMAVLTMVYDHHRPDLQMKLTDIQHESHNIVHSSLHIHLDHHNCMEIIVLKGSAKQIIQVGENLISTKGVKHGKLVLTTTGSDLT